MNLGQMLAGLGMNTERKPKGRWGGGVLPSGYKGSTEQRFKRDGKSSETEHWSGRQDATVYAPHVKSTLSRKDLRNG